MLDLSSNMASNRKMDTSDVSGIQFYVELIPSLVIYSPFGCLLDFTLQWPYAMAFQKDLLKC